jgi:exonuclease III
MKIISWNIATLPWYVNLNGNPINRIDKIIIKIKSLKADIICLQEVFDKRIIQILKDNFDNKYNYNIIFSPNSSIFYKINGGLCIIIKSKILYNNNYIFKHSCGEDFFSEKGLLYIITKINNKKVAIINTHLNNNNPIFIINGDIELTQKYQLNVVIQFIKKFNKKYNINSFIFGGDLNIEINSKKYKTLYNNIKKQYKNIIVNNTKLLTFNKKQYDYIFCINKKKKEKENKKIFFNINGHDNLSDHNIIEVNVPIKFF